MAECGTKQGYQRHRRRGEEACEPCRLANNEWHRAYQNGPRFRAWRAAEQRALRRLAGEFRDRYEALLAEEMARGKAGS